MISNSEHIIPKISKYRTENLYCTSCQPANIAVLPFLGKSREIPRNFVVVCAVPKCVFDFPSCAIILLHYYIHAFLHFSFVTKLLYNISPLK